MSSDCILLSSDLMLVSKVQGAAERAGRSIRIVASGAQLESLLDESPVARVAIDLSTPGLRIDHTVTMLRALSPPPEIIAFGPHVQEGLLDAARNAGCDRVLSRGQFHAQMESLLAP